jgi:predicted transcriptional regulator
MYNDSENVSTSSTSKEQLVSTSTKAKRMSAAHSLLAILWHIGEGTLRIFISHRYAKIYLGKKSQNTLKTSLTRLRKKGLIRRTKRGTFGITPEGKREGLLAYITAEALLKRPKPDDWDGGWRFIFFDIPESKRRYRDFLREVLKLIGFHELQKSVWVYPHQVPSYLKDLLWEEHIKPYTRFITTELIDYDRDLRKIFGLKEPKRGIF